MPRKWTTCDIKGGRPRIRGPEHDAELMVGEKRRNGQYGVKLKKQNKTAFCRDNHTPDFFSMVNLLGEEQAKERVIGRKIRREFDSFVDMCRLAKKLLKDHRQGIYKVPALKVVSTKATKGARSVRTLEISRDLAVKLKRKLAEGAYGQVYDASGPKGPYERLVVKQNSGAVDKKGDMMEVLIQTVLHCDQRTMGGVALAKAAAKNRVQVPFVPKVLYYGSMNNRSNSYIVMEHVNMTLADFLSDKETTRAVAIKCLKQLCILLDHYQTKFGFMHRDMHGKNVMVKFNPRRRADAKVALIDFGMSCLTIPKDETAKVASVKLGYPSRGQDAQKYDLKHMYRGHNTAYNTTHDLRMLLISLFRPDRKGDEIMTKLPEIYADVILPIFRKVCSSPPPLEYRPIQRKYAELGGVCQLPWGPHDIRPMVQRGSPYWAFYKEAVRVYSKECAPKALLKRLSSLPQVYTGDPIITP